MINSSSAPSKLQAYLELLRVPNVFTAMADILVGYWLTHDALQPVSLVALLLGASSLLYLSGMVLNDVFDRQRDTQDRPSRPIPSGRVSLAAARRLGFGMMAAGLACACGAALMAGHFGAILVAALLAAAVLAYDAGLKGSIFGPLLMGCCRLLNVLLGMSGMQQPWPPAGWLLAIGLGVYVAGITWFARTEARRSRQASLLAGVMVILVGLGLWSRAPALLPPGLVQVSPERWLLFSTVITVLIVWRCVRAVLDPRPELVQLAVKNCIISIIVLDAGVCFAARGPTAALGILLLILPTMFIGRWVYST